MSPFTFDLHTRLRHAQVTREARSARGAHAHAIGASADARAALRLPFDDPAADASGIMARRSHNTGGES